MQHRYLTARQTAAMLQLNVESIYDMAAVGEIPAAKIRGRWRFDADEIQEWFKAQCAQRKAEGGDE